MNQTSTNHYLFKKTEQQTINKLYDFKDIDSQEGRKFANDINMDIASRKTWEHFFQFHILNENDLIHEDSKGISFGAGKEHMLYYLSNKVGEIWATDLYESSTSWWGDANTDNPELYIKTNPPLEFNPHALKAKFADMRDLSYFDDNYFDFAYSSCAVSHIGYYSDFLSHLKEAYRVLKPGGMYVVTTEVTLSGLFIEDLGMHFFNIPVLSSLIKESGFNTNKYINYEQSEVIENAPLLLNERHISFSDNGLRDELMLKYQNVYAKVGRNQIYADEIYSGIVLGLVKEQQTFGELEVINSENPWTLDKNLFNQPVKMDPCGFFKAAKCFWKLGHYEDFNKFEELSQTANKLLIHTPYYYWGSGIKELNISLDYTYNVNVLIAFKVVLHSKYNTDHSQDIYLENIKIENDSSLKHSFSTECPEGNSCAIWGSYYGGSAAYVDTIEIDMQPKTRYSDDSYTYDFEDITSFADVLLSSYSEAII